MKKFIKHNYKLFLGIIIGIVLSTITVYAISLPFNSGDVLYDNSTSGLSSTNVKGAIDELYSTYNSIGTATAADIVTGKTAFAKGSLLNGSMSNYSGATKTATGSISDNVLKLKVPETGYYTTSSYLQLNPGTATKAQVLEDKTFTSTAGVNVAGEMPNWSSYNTTSNHLEGEIYKDSDGFLTVRPDDSGYFKGGSSGTVISTIVEWNPERTVEKGASTGTATSAGDTSSNTIRLDEKYKVIIPSGYYSSDITVHNNGSSSTPQLLGCTMSSSDTISGTIPADGTLVASGFAFVDDPKQIPSASLKINNTNKTNYAFNKSTEFRSMHAWNISVKAKDTWELKFSPGGDNTLRFHYGGCVFLYK